MPSSLDPPRPLLSETLAVLQSEVEARNEEEGHRGGEKDSESQGDRHRNQKLSLDGIIEDEGEETGEGRQ